MRGGDITQHISHDMGLHDVFCGFRPMTLRIDFAQGRMMVLDKRDGFTQSAPLDEADVC